MPPLKVGDRVRFKKGYAPGWHGRRVQLGGQTGKVIYVGSLDDPVALSIRCDEILPQLEENHNRIDYWSRTMSPDDGHSVSKIMTYLDKI